MLAEYGGQASEEKELETLHENFLAKYEVFFVSILAAGQLTLDLPKT